MQQAIHKSLAACNLFSQPNGALKMATKESTFSIAGVVRDGTKGDLRIKFANDMARVKKLGTVNTELRMFELGKAMLKAQCVMALRLIPDLRDAPTLALIDDFLKKNGIDPATLPEPAAEVEDDTVAQDEQPDTVAQDGDEEQDEVISELPDFEYMPDDAVDNSREVELA